jgi:hypothetical protein
MLHLEIALNVTPQWVHKFMYKDIVVYCRRGMEEPCYIYPGLGGGGISGISISLSSTPRIYDSHPEMNTSAEAEFITVTTPPPF